LAPVIRGRERGRGGVLGMARGLGYGMAMDKPAAKGVERMFPFVLRARALIVGRDTLRRSKGRLHFVLITRDISDTSREEILADFAHYPIVQHYLAPDLEKHFGIKGAK